MTFKSKPKLTQFRQLYLDSCVYGTHLYIPAPLPIPPMPSGPTQTVVKTENCNTELPQPTVAVLVEKGRDVANDVHLPHSGQNLRVFAAVVERSNGVEANSAFVLSAHV